MENDYYEDFKAIATMCEKGRRDLALTFFNSLVEVIREDKN